MAHSLSLVSKQYTNGGYQRKKLIILVLVGFLSIFPPIAYVNISTKNLILTINSEYHNNMEKNKIKAKGGKKVQQTKEHVLTHRYQGCFNKDPKQLTKEQIDHFNEHGYVIIPNVISAEECDRCLDEIWEMIEKCSLAKRKDSSTWDGNPFEKMGFINTYPVYHLATVWAMRQNPKIYQMFADLHEEQQLWVSLDRVSLKRPGIVNGVKKPDWQCGTWYHTDLNPHFLPSNLQVQGLISLLDTNEDQGSLHIVPGWNWDIDDWAKNNPKQAYPENKTLCFFKDQDAIKGRTKQLSFKKGDMLIFNSCLIHGSYANTSPLWRSFVYITYFAPRYNDQELVNERINSYKSGKNISKFATGTAAPSSKPSPELEAAYVPPKLTSLGKKLLGLLSWYDDDEEDEEKNNDNNNKSNNNNNNNNNASGSK